MIEVKTAGIGQLEEICRVIGIGAREGMILKRTRQELRELIGKKNFFVAVENGRIVGTVCLDFYSKRLSELRTIFILKEFRGSGIGGKLVEKVLKRAKALKVKEIMFVTTKALKPWLKKQGFMQEMHGFKVVFFKKT